MGISKGARISQSTNIESYILVAQKIELFGVSKRYLYFNWQIRMILFLYAGQNSLQNKLYFSLYTLFHITSCLSQIQTGNASNLSYHETIKIPRIWEK